jgi:alpha-ketoglutarate-dependent taurine dioxygenase
VRFKWREGDMVTLDNMITAHARDPFVGPRKIVVALGDLVQGADLDRASA